MNGKRDHIRRILFRGFELKKVQFIPTKPNDPNSYIQLDGKVVVVKPGYSLIEVQSYPRFLCPGSKYNGLILERNMLVKFVPAFTAKGKIAIIPVEMNGD